MDHDSPELKAFLNEVYQLIQGMDGEDIIEKQVSMYDAGAVLGLDRTESSAMAEALFLHELAELKTLSGGIGITQKGLETLQVEMGVGFDKNRYRLSQGPVLDQNDIGIIRDLVSDIRKTVDQAGLSFEQAEELVMDIKTLEIHLLSNRPKTAIVKEIARSILSILSPTGLQKICAGLSGVIG